MLEGKRGPGIKAVGCKIFYYHLTDEEWTKLASHKGLKILHIMRRNRLRTIVSLEIARRTDRWAQTEASSRFDPIEKEVRLETSNLVTRLDQIATDERLIRERFEDQFMYEVYYEDLVADPISRFEDVTKFLEVQQIDVGKIKLRKQNPEPLSVLISNYKSVRALLQKTKYESYLK
jgi:LPS sulfotransferase NodH